MTDAPSSFLDRLELLLKQASERPWWVKRDREGDVSVAANTGVDAPYIAYLADGGDPYIEDAVADGTLIVALVNAAPALVAASRALERLVAGLETNSEAGAPDYAHAALAVLSDTDANEEAKT